MTWIATICGHNILSRKVHKFNVANNTDYERDIVVVRPTRFSVLVKTTILNCWKEKMKGWKRCTWRLKDNGTKGRGRGGARNNRRKKRKRRRNRKEKRKQKKR